MLATFPIHPALPPADLARARAWYEDKLGFLPEQEDMGGLWYRSGGQSFLVFGTHNAGTAGNTAAGWTVTGIEAVMDELRARGVVFEIYDIPGAEVVDGLHTMGGYKACWFRDSEANILELSQVPPVG
jgi:catechol 2,3-dioxygenase-like lactoylglutathione lyase family enzyme